jgi:ABC-type multidrug transport system ATPase subunit
MKLVTVIVTRSKSCHVKTLHAILRLNLKCVQTNFTNEIVFVDDDSYKKSHAVEQYMKKCDRIIFIDFGIGLDDETIKQLFEKHESIGCLVFPGVKEGVDWDLFKKKVRENSKEPNEQMGLHFDTEVGKKISDNIYSVVNTEARVWLINCKNVIKSIKDKKTGNVTIHPKMLEKFKEKGVKIYAFTASKLTMTYAHECISNILNAAGVKTS